MKRFLITSLLTSGLCIGYAQQPDNTKANKEAQPTADQSKNSKSDLKLTQQIRREIVKDKSLSMDAHNVKVVVSDGKVTLKGPVKSDQEKTAIEEKAAAIAGAGNVINELTVKGS
jgi:hyperosmotically inducible protein